MGGTQSDGAVDCTSDGKGRLLAITSQDTILRNYIYALECNILDEQKKIDQSPKPPGRGARLVAHKKTTCLCIKK